MENKTGNRYIQSRKKVLCEKAKQFREQLIEERENEKEKEQNKKKFSIRGNLHLQGKLQLLFKYIEKA